MKFGIHSQAFIYIYYIIAYQIYFLQLLLHNSVSNLLFTTYLLSQKCPLNEYANESISILICICYIIIYQILFTEFRRSIGLSSSVFASKNAYYYSQDRKGNELASYFSKNVFYWKYYTKRFVFVT